MRHYVYTLAYPDGRVFYVGKGKSNRIDEHEYEARRGVQSPKCDVIRAIWAEGGNVVKTKVAAFPSHEEALRYEHYLISTLPGLVNAQPGEGRFNTVSLLPEDQVFFGASIRRIDEQGIEYWSARDMANFLGYGTWRPFYALIGRVENNLTNAGVDIAPHFQHVQICVELARDAGRYVEDVRLSHIGFLLVLTNADKKKALVVYGKSHIALQALRATHPEAAPTPNPISRTLLAHKPAQKTRMKHSQKGEASRE